MYTYYVEVPSSERSESIINRTDVLATEDAHCQAIGIKINDAYGIRGEHLSVTMATTTIHKQCLILALNGLDCI